MARGHPLPHPDVFGKILDEKRFAEVALQVLKELPKVGRKSGKAFARATDADIEDECLAEANGHAPKAQRSFIEKVVASMSEKSQANGSAAVTAKNRWYLATIADGRTRRAGRK